MIHHFERDDTIRCFHCGNIVPMKLVGRDIVTFKTLFLFTDNLLNTAIGYIGKQLPKIFCTIQCNGKFCQGEKGYLASGFKALQTAIADTASFAKLLL